MNSGVGRALPALKRASGTSPADVIASLCAARLAFLRGLPTWGTFGKGWTTRVNAVRAQALAMAASAPKSSAPDPMAPMTKVVSAIKPAPSGGLSSAPSPAPTTAPVPPAVASEPQDLLHRVLGRLRTAYPAQPKKV